MEQSDDSYATPAYEIRITTYEISGDQPKPVLSHVFYGDTLDQAVGYARSHLVTDLFFSSSFVGQLPWRDSVLRMSNQGDVIGLDYPEGQSILGYLNAMAHKIRQVQTEKGLVVAIHRLSKWLP